MSVARAVQAPKVTLYQPGATIEDNLPIGVWFGRSTVTGDASGGSASTPIAPISALEASRYGWSLEGFNAQAEAAAALHGTLQYVTGETYEDPVLGVFILGFKRDVNLVSQVAQAIAVPAATPTKDDMDYITLPDGVHTPSWDFVWDDNVNARVYTFIVWGFVWGRYARRFAGGPRRP